MNHHSHHQAAAIYCAHRDSKAAYPSIHPGKGRQL